MPDLAHLQPGAEADRVVAQAMGWTTGDDGTGRTTWFDPRYPDVEVWPCPGFTTDDRWIGTMLETLSEGESFWEAWSSHEWQKSKRVYGWLLRRQGKQLRHNVFFLLMRYDEEADFPLVIEVQQGKTLFEAVWRCLLAVVERQEDGA